MKTLPEALPHLPVGQQASSSDLTAFLSGHGHLQQTPLLPPNPKVKQDEQPTLLAVISQGSWSTEEIPT